MLINRRIIWIVSDIDMEVIWTMYDICKDMKEIVVKIL